MLQLDSHRARVLVVDDDPMVLDLVTTRLSLAGCTTYSARDGLAAVERLRDIRPTAMVLDINMPGLDGFGVLEHMKATGFIKSTATLVLTARNRPEDVKLAVSLGARDYLSKPFKDEQLLIRMARLLRHRSPMPGPSAG
ncbi:response regulator [Phenylobacterium sp.]|uniref:response regulator n=1 Tax=Phenylobacterium sp. TaxID=1871053 RepID=UPI003D2DFD5B